MKKVLVLWLLIGSTAFAGGVSGGGGNTKPAHPVDADMVRFAIANSRLYVTTYFNSLEANWKYSSGGKHDPLLDKLFGGPTQVTDWALRWPVRLEENGPCLDPGGNPVDGSAKMDPPEVCLSVPRLVEKLSRESLRSEIIALVLHEFTHLVGATEAEAEQTQNEAIDRLFWADFKSMMEMMYDAKRILREISDFAAGPRQDADPETWDDVARKSYRHIYDFDVYFLYAPSMAVPFGPWSIHLRENFDQTYHRMDLISKAACDFSGDPQNRHCHEELEKFFQGDEELDYHTYMLRLGYKEGHFTDHPGVRFRRVRNFDDLKIERDRLKLDVQGYQGYVCALLRCE
jgi:hypothetical protein